MGRKLEKVFLMLCLSFFSILTIAYGQTRTFQGKITDSLGAPIQGAAILDQNTKKTTMSSNDGSFHINVNNEDVLSVSLLNYKTTTYNVGSSSDGIIILKPSVSDLGEIVVTTGLGIRQQTKQLGYSTALITGKDINAVGVTNVLNGLSAKVSGLDIRLADNTINPNVMITLRGNRSIAGNNQALIIVDGNPVDQNYLASLNPLDIQDANILKGAQAAAIYGKEAANGVLVINLKKGTKGPLHIEYKNTTMFNKVSYMPKMQNEYSPNGGESSYIDPLTGMPLPVPYENQNYGPAYNSKDFPYDSIAIGGSGDNIKYGPYVGYKDGRKNFFVTGLNEQNSISLSGGGKLGSFFASGQHATNHGIVDKDRSVRNTANLGGNLKIGKFSASGSVNYTHLHIDQAGLGYGGGVQYRPVYWSVLNQPPNIDLKTVKDVDGDYFANPNGYINQYYTNPWQTVYHSRAEQNTKTLNSNLTLNYQFTDWLSVTARSGYNKTWIEAPSHIDAFTYDSIAASDPWGAGGTAATSPSMPYQSELVKVNYYDWNTDGFITAKHKVNDFTFTLMAGANYRKKESYGYWWSNQATAYMAIPTTINTVSNDDGSADVFYRYKYNSQSVYGDLNIGYDNWLYLHGTYRNDWVSILEPSKRSFSYWGTDVSAVLSDKFPEIKSENGISYLKVRAGYSVTGNISIPSTRQLGVFANTSYGITLPTYGAYGIYPTATVATGFPYGSTDGYSLSYSGVQPGLKPELDKGYEVGFELGLLRNRINFQATYYATGATNQTLSQQVPGSTGTSTLLLNTGKVQDNGLEMDLKLTPLLKLGDFFWNVGANLSLLSDKLSYITKGENSGTIVLAGSGSSLYNIDAVVGNQLASLYVSDWQRDPQGHIIVGTNGLPVGVDPNFKYAGNTNYRQRLGLNTTFGYKRLSLSAVVDYRGGAKMINTFGNVLDFSGLSESSAANRQHFIIPNSVVSDGNGGYVTNTNYPTTGTAAQWWSTTYNGIGAPYVVSAAFWKLREININYDIPISILGNQKLIKSMNFALIGQNLFMWRPKSNQWTDPEFSTSINANKNAVGAVNEYVTPPLRSFGFSFTASF